jgi:hypothetical protein
MKRSSSGEVTAREKDARITALELQLQKALAKVPKVVDDPVEFVRHIFWQVAETNAKEEYASDNTKKSFIGSFGRDEAAIFGKLLVSTRKMCKHNTAPTVNTIPWGSGVNHSTKWTSPLDNRCEFRFWGRHKDYCVTVRVDLYTHCRNFKLRTLIDDVDSSTAASSEDPKSVQTYFTPTADELEKNNYSTEFNFRANVVMCTK